MSTHQEWNILFLTIEKVIDRAENAFGKVLEYKLYEHKVIKKNRIYKSSSSSLNILKRNRFKVLIDFWYLKI